MNEKRTEGSALSRRRFLAATGTAAVGLAVGGFPHIAKAADSIPLPPLPYAENALEPVISARTLRFHYGKHHQGYVDNLNKLLADTDWAGLDLETIVLKSAKASDKQAVFNNAAQVQISLAHRIVHGWNMAPVSRSRSEERHRRCRRH